MLLRRRPAPGLGPEWAITGDDGGDITLWREDRRAGVAGRAPFSSRWEARRASGGPVTTLAARGGMYPSRTKALAAHVEQMKCQQQAVHEGVLPRERTTFILKCMEE